MNYNLDNQQWGNFKIVDLFEVQKSTLKLKKEQLLENADNLYPVYSSDSNNNGIIGYTNINPTYVVGTKERPFDIVFGEHTRTMNIAENSYCVADNVKSLRPIFDEINVNIALFIASSWKKSIPNLGYNRHWSKAKDVLFKIPITPSGEPDYNFMNDFITELKNNKINKLQNNFGNI